MKNNPWKMIRPRRIDPPRYRVGRYVLNEYELRCLMAQVSRGEVEPGFRVTHLQSGTTKVIRPDGLFDGRLGGLDIASGFTLEIIRSNRERENRQQLAADCHCGSPACEGNHPDA